MFLCVHNFIQNSGASFFSKCFVFHYPSLTLSRWHRSTHLRGCTHTHTSGSRFARRVCKKNRPKRSPSHLHMHNVYREKSSPSIRVSSVIFMTNSPKVAKYVEWRKLAESGHPGPKALCMNDRNDCGPRLRGLFSAVGSLFLQASVIQFPIGFCYRQVVILLWLLGIAIIISKWKA
jgi:hypothetical protein